MTEDDFELELGDCNTANMKLIEKELDKVKYSAFGKVKMKFTNISKKGPDMTNDDLLKAQRTEIENQLKRVEAIKHVNPTLRRGGGRNHPPPSENRVFSATEHRMNPRPVCKFEFCRCGPVEKN